MNRSKIWLKSIQQLPEELLRQSNFINAEQFTQALQVQAAGQSLGEVLLKLGYFTEEQLFQCLLEYLNIPQFPLEQINLDLELASTVPFSLLQSHQVLPLTRQGSSLVLAMADPLNLLAIEDLQMATGCTIKPVFVLPEEMDRIITKLREADWSGELEKNLQKVLGNLAAYPEDSVFTEETSLESEEESLIVRLVNEIMVQAIQRRASDIHIEPYEAAKSEIRVRYRIDGVLYEVMKLPKKSSRALIARLKIMANLDIAERRIPQDGRLRINYGSAFLDARISTLPTICGEKAMLRILDRREEIPTIDSLTLQGMNQQRFEKIIRQKSGLILVCGPTGSGKTTTLYSILNDLNRTAQNIITLEDPVECILPGINQVQVNPRAGFDFVNGLRSVLRQDPDVIMVGEIRDQETAELAVQAALTGHLVFSTLHTRKAVSAPVRLMDMGIEPFLLSSALIGVIAQRLVRKVCTDCGVPAEIPPHLAQYMGLEVGKTRLYKGAGCPFCNQSGFRNRMALQEVLVFTQELKAKIESRISEDGLEQIALEQGMVSLWKDGLNKALQGKTRIEEVLGVMDFPEEPLRT